MDLQQIIARAGGLEAIATQLGVNQDQAANGLNALLPAVVGGFKKKAGSHDQGIGGLVDMLNAYGGGGLVDNVVSAQPTDIGLGNNILGQIFGSKEVSRAVATHASTQSGLDASLLKKMLPIITMLVAGFMTKGTEAQSGRAGGDTSDGTGLGGLLGGLLGGGQPAAGAGGGLGGLGALLDADGDGNPLDDIIGMLGKLSAR